MQVWNQLLKEELQKIESHLPDSLWHSIAQQGAGSVRQFIASRLAWIRRKHMDYEQRLVHRYLYSMIPEAFESMADGSWLCLDDCTGQVHDLNPTMEFSATHPTNVMRWSPYRVKQVEHVSYLDIEIISLSPLKIKLQSRYPVTWNHSLVIPLVNGEVSWSLWVLFYCFRHVTIQGKADNHSIHWSGINFELLIQDPIVPKMVGSSMALACTASKLQCCHHIRWPMDLRGWTSLEICWTQSLDLDFEQKIAQTLASGRCQIVSHWVPVLKRWRSSVPWIPIWGEGCIKSPIAEVLIQRVESLSGWSRGHEQKIIALDPDFFESSQTLRLQELPHYEAYVADVICVGKHSLQTDTHETWCLKDDFDSHWRMAPVSNMSLHINSICDPVQLENALENLRVQSLNSLSPLIRLLCRGEPQSMDAADAIESVHLQNNSRHYKLNPKASLESMALAIHLIQLAERYLWILGYWAFCPQWSIKLLNNQVMVYENS